MLEKKWVQQIDVPPPHLVPQTFLVSEEKWQLRDAQIYHREAWEGKIGGNILNIFVLVTFLALGWWTKGQRTSDLQVVD